MQARPVGRGASLPGRQCRGVGTPKRVEHVEQEIRIKPAVDKARPTAKQGSYLRDLRR